MRERGNISVVIVTTALFALVALLVVLKLTTDLDKAVFSAMKPFAGSTLDSAMSAITLLGRVDVAVAIAIAAAVLIGRERLVSGLAPLAIFGVIAAVDAVKSAIGQLRPPAGVARDLQLLPTLLPKTTETYSFPSSHAALAVFLAVVVGNAAPRWRPLLWAIAGAVALSRLYLSKHWLSDVVGGVLLGLVIGELAWLAVTVIAARKPRRKSGT